ncbi:MAG TPA: hypothetical protein VLC74_07650 [Rhizomicrobium sp.]|nr:hypothetical protein [Rhizomicrobium sp.]
MWFQPLIYFSALVWAVAFAVFGVYLAVRRGSVPLLDRFMGFVAAVVVGGLGASIMIGVFYLVEELIWVL